MYPSLKTSYMFTFKQHLAASEKPAVQLKTTKWSFEILNPYSSQVLKASRAYPQHDICKADLNMRYKL